MERKPRTGGLVGLVNPLVGRLRVGGQFVVNALLGMLLLSGLSIAVWRVPSAAILEVVGDGELAGVLGAACQGAEGSASFCSSTTINFCIGTTAPYLHHLGSNALKAWCAAPPAGNGPVCNCNQTGVPHVPCVNIASCTGKTGQTCTGCGVYSPQAYVQNQVNLDGAPCTKDADCGT